MRVITVCGPTASGKTDLAVALARHFKTEIVSYDSLQIYKGLDIGTAKPSQELLKEIRHHFIDIIDPDETYSAGEYRRAALETLSRLKTKSVVVMVGGTGFYLKALIDGMFDTPATTPEVKRIIESRLEKEGRQKLYEELKIKDPEAALRVHLNDTYRLLRAHEILLMTGKPMSQKLTGEKFPYEVQKLGILKDRSKLREAVVARTEKMIDSGLVEETAKLKEKYPDFETLRPLQSIGYKETLAYLEGYITREELRDLIVKNTMALAKRQMTWLRKDREVKWATDFSDLDKI